MPGAVPIHQNLEVLDAPHVQDALTIAIGLSVGLLFGFIVASFVKHTKPTILCACGCLIGGIVSWYMPQPYAILAPRYKFITRIPIRAKLRQLCWR
jgi:membrane protein YqaA with SNARE-associated domain